MFAQCMQVVEHHEDLLQQATGIETLEGQFLGMTLCLHLHDNYNFHEQRKKLTILYDKSNVTLSAALSIQNVR